MSFRVPRLRLFAGPNGSGKSVLNAYLPPALLGIYINPDELEKGVKKSGYWDLTPFNIHPATDEILWAFTQSDFLRKAGFTSLTKRFSFEDNRLWIPPDEMNSYIASVASDYLRRKLLEHRINFTFESVMSHPDKVALLKHAQQAGYRTYLYYVATEDPVINVSRVANRVALGGHTVPEDKIIDRYHRSLELLLDAIRASDRAYIFDNSTDNSEEAHTWIAEVSDGRVLELKTNLVPNWFKRAVLDKI